MAVACPDTDFLTGLVTGVGATIVGFLLSQVAVSLRSRADRVRREQAVLTALLEESRGNRASATNTQSLIQTEQSQIATGGFGVLNPLDLLETGAWDLLVMQLPEAVASDDELLATLRDYKRLTNQVNEMIRSRERSRFSTSQDPPELAGYDTLIHTFLGELIIAIDRIEPKLQDLRGPTK